MELITFINSWMAAAITLSGGVVAVLTSFYYWTKAAKSKRKEEDGQEERIKKLLNERIDYQDEKMHRMQGQIDDGNAETARLKLRQKELESENNNYLKIFQGRDEDSIKYKQEGRESMMVVRENSRMLTKIMEHHEENDRKFNIILDEIKKIYALLADKYMKEKKKSETSGVMDMNTSSS